MNRVLLAISAFLALSPLPSCAPQPEPRQPVAPPPPAVQQPPTPPTPVPEKPAPKQDREQDMQERTRRMQKEMTEVRGLALKTDVRVGLYTKDELVKFLRTEMDREFPKEKAEKWQKIYAHFGLVPADMDLRESFIELMGSSIAGFYHPKSKEMRLIRHTGDEKSFEKAMEKQMEKLLGIKMEDVTLVHELCHAGQDQNHDLVSLPIEDETNDDQILAIKALIEGDASIVGWKWALGDERFEMLLDQMNNGYKMAQLPGKAGKLPAFLRKTLTFPYGYGAEFVKAVWNKSNDDWKAVSKMFDDPPASSEQILHPEKYFGAERDYPVVITLDNVGGLVGAGWTELGHNVHGQFVVRILLNEFKPLPGKKLDEAARGWDGDRYHAFERNGRLLTVWYTAWDSDNDAQEFFDAYSALLEKKYEGAANKAAGQKIVLDLNGTKMLVERRNADVLVLDGADDAVLDAANRIWSSAKKTEVRKIERVTLTHYCPAHPHEKGIKPEKCYECGEEMKPIPADKGSEKGKKDY